MTDRRLGSSHLHTPKLCLGGNVFGWTADKATSFAILDAFADAGGTLVDTADVYSAWVPGHKGGESESVIGEWLKTSGKTMHIATKVGMLPWDNKGSPNLAPDQIEASCDASLERLGIEQIALYYAHQDDQAITQEAYMKAFAKLVAAGKVATLGASNFHAARLKSANDIARAAGQPHFEVLQPEYSLVRRHRYEGELQDYCCAHNIGVLSYYGLANGFLTGKYRSADDFGKSVRGGRMQAYLDGKGLAVLAAMDAVAEECGATLAQIALVWLAAQPGITAPIASVTSVAQLQELLPAMELELSVAQLEKLDAAGA